MLCWDRATNSHTVTLPCPFINVSGAKKRSKSGFFLVWLQISSPNHVFPQWDNLFMHSEPCEVSYVNLPQVSSEGQTAHTDPRMAPRSFCVHSFFISEHSTSSITRSTLVATTDNFLSLCLDEQWPDSCFHPHRLKRLWSIFLVSPGGFRPVLVTNC